MKITQSKLSKFFNNTSPEERRKVFMKVIRESVKAQKKVIEETKCKIGGAGRNEKGFLDFYCKFCNRIMLEDDENKKICIVEEMETTNYLYSEIKRLEKIIKNIELFIIEDVPHQYQTRLLREIINK